MVVGNKWGLNKELFRKSYGFVSISPCINGCGIDLMNDLGIALGNDSGFGDLFRNCSVTQFEVWLGFASISPCIIGLGIDLGTWFGDWFSKWFGSIGSRKGLGDGFRIGLGYPSGIGSANGFMDSIGN